MGLPDPDPAAPAGWPRWARRLATAALLFHAVAIVAGVMQPQPSSDLEAAVDAQFAWYQGLTRQGQSYRFYSPEPPPTPVVTASLAFRDGRPDEVVRIPDRATRPRLLYQRQLALAHYLTADADDARRNSPDHDPGRSRWARAYATHLGLTHPGCNSVTLRGQVHLIPPLDRVADELRHPRPGQAALDLDADEFYSTPERIGVFPCDAS